MPKFAALMDGPTVRVDTGDGVRTPRRQVEIADCLQTIRAK